MLENDRSVLTRTFEEGVALNDKRAIAIRNCDGSDDASTLMSR